VDAPHPRQVDSSSALRAGILESHFPV